MKLIRQTLKKNYFAIIHRGLTGLTGILLIAGITLTACSAYPGDWSQTAEVTGISSDGLTLSFSGIAPFDLEFYDNPLFDGNIKVTDTATSLEYTIPTGLPAGAPYYLRYKSAFAKTWVILGGADDPTMLMRTSGTTEGNSTWPYIIRTKADLIALSEQAPQYGGPAAGGAWTRNYVLAHDIDLTGVVWKPIAPSNATRFTGTFNGAGHMITGLEKLDETVIAGNSAGLFGEIGSTGTVKNLGLKVGNLECESCQNLAGMAGAHMDNAIIQNCYVIGTSIRGGSVNTGGFTGTTWGIINDCFSDITVESNAIDSAGGFVGIFASTNTRSNCYSAGNLIYSGNLSKAGGFTHSISGTVKNCVALNNRIEKTSGTTAALKVFSAGAGTVTNCFYNSKMSYPADSLIVSGSVSPLSINPCRMNQNSPPFNQWDFVNTWKWDDAKNRPVLRKVRM